MRRIQEALRCLEDKRTADVCRLVDVQDTAKDQVPNVLTCASTAAKKAFGQEIAEDQDGMANVLVRNTTDTAETVQRTVASLKICQRQIQQQHLQTRSRKQRKEGQTSECS